MYTWGYLKDAILSKLDLEEEEAETMNFLRRFPFYANEAMTQICSAIKPKKTFFEIEVNPTKYKTEWKDDRFVKTEIVDEEGNLDIPLTMPDDFISFGDDVNTIDEDIGYGTMLEREAFDEDFSYHGYNQIICHKKGKYRISYNARWLTFGSFQNSKVLEAPTDVLDCIPSYVASQCMKVDDEVKSSIFRNEYEMFLARIDNTDFKSNKTLTIGGDW